MTINNSYENKTELTGYEKAKKRRNSINSSRNLTNYNVGIGIVISTKCSKNVYIAYVIEYKEINLSKF